MKTPATFDVAGEAARRRDENDKWAPAALLPAEAFGDEPAGETVFRRLCAPETPRGRHAWAVHRRIMSSCAGWEKRPTNPWRTPAGLHTRRGRPSRLGDALTLSNACAMFAAGEA